MSMKKKFIWSFMKSRIMIKFNGQIEDLEDLIGKSCDLFDPLLNDTWCDKAFITGVMVFSGWSNGQFGGISEKVKKRQGYVYCTYTTRYSDKNCGIFPIEKIVNIRKVERKFLIRYPFTASIRQKFLKL